MFGGNMFGGTFLGGIQNAISGILRAIAASKNKIASIVGRSVDSASIRKSTGTAPIRKDT